MHIVRLTKQNILALHRYVGLTAGLIILLQTTTGAVLAFYDELDRLIASHLYQVEAKELLPPVALYQATKTWDFTETKPNFIVPAEMPGKSAIIYLEPEGSQSSVREVYVDPSTGEILGDRSNNSKFCWRSECVMPFILGFHVNLTIGEPGLWIMGIVALLWLGTTALGVIVTLPPRGKGRLRRWRSAWKLPAQPHKGPGRRVLSGVHRSIGLWTLLFAVYFAFTGFVLALGDEVVRPFLDVVSPTTESNLHQRYVSDDFEYHVDLENALQISAQAANEYAKERDLNVTWMSGIAFEWQHGGYDIFYDLDKGPIPNHNYINVSVDGSTGDVMGIRSRLGDSAGDAFMAWMYPLHSGRVLGFWGRLIVGVVGVAILIFGSLGVVLWWQRRRNRIRREYEKARMARFTDGEASGNR